MDEQSGDLWQQFARFHKKNPHVWLIFVRFAIEALASGRTYYSARDIIHRIRWHMNIELKAVDEFKINNNWSPYYARLFVKVYPKMITFFEFRVAKENPELEKALLDDVRKLAIRARLKGLLNDKTLR